MHAKMRPDTVSERTRIGLRRTPPQTTVGEGQRSSSWIREESGYTVKTVQVGKTFRVFNQLGSGKVVEKSVRKLERSHKGKYEDL